MHFQEPGLVGLSVGQRKGKGWCLPQPKATALSGQCEPRRGCCNIWIALGGRIEIRARWGICPFFCSSASGYWYIFIINCQLFLPSQRIKISSKSVCAFVSRHLPRIRLSAVINWNRMMLRITPDVGLDPYTTSKDAAVRDRLAGLVPLNAPLMLPIHAELYSELCVASASWTEAQR